MANSIAKSFTCYRTIVAAEAVIRSNPRVTFSELFVLDLKRRVVDAEPLTQQRIQTLQDTATGAQMMPHDMPAHRFHVER